MDFTALKNSLGLENSALKSDQVVIATSSLTDNLNTLLEYCYDNQPIVIEHAQFVAEDAAGNALTIKGQANFLRISGLETEVRFSIDDQGQVQLFLKYSLIGSQPSPNAWRFSTSFPNLPQVPDLNQPTYFNRDTQ